MLKSLFLKSCRPLGLLQDLSFSQTFKNLFFFRGHSSQIHQIHAKSKNLKSLKYPPFDSLIENKKLQKFQLYSLSGSDFMEILKILPAEFENKM